MTGLHNSSFEHTLEANFCRDRFHAENESKKKIIISKFEDTTFTERESGYLCLTALVTKEKDILESHKT